MRNPTDLWGRRAAALGVVLVLAAGIGGIVLAVTGGDDDEASSSQQAQASSIELEETLRRKAAGLSVDYPSSWRHTRKGPLDSLESPDRCTVISFSAPVGAGGAPRLMRDSVQLIGDSFQRTGIRGQPVSQLGGLPTANSLLALRNRQGNPVVIRLSVSRGPKFAHLVQVVLRAPPCAESADETAAVLQSVVYDR
jgi:hypothetical protein